MGRGESGRLGQWRVRACWSGVTAASVNYLIESSHWEFFVCSFVVAFSGNMWGTRVKKNINNIGEVETPLSTLFIAAAVVVAAVLKGSGFLVLQLLLLLLLVLVLS